MGRSRVALMSGSRVAALASALGLAVGLGAPAVTHASDPGVGDGETARQPRAWYLPDQAKVQLAGNIGFISPGVGWSWLERRLEGDLFFGWVPESVGGIDIYSLTGKLTWLPWRIQAGDDWQITPATLALQVTYTFGHDYFLLLPERYPTGYYSVPTAVRSGLALGGGVGRSLWGQRHVGLYYELVAVDAGLSFWLTNRRAVSVTDVFSLALGLRVEL